MNVASSYLWDYLRKATAYGFFIPLSGGADSSVTALMIYHLCTNIMSDVKMGNLEVLVTLRSIFKDKNFIPKNAKQIMNKIMHTSYMSTPYSTPESKKRSNDLAEQMGSNHLATELDILLEKFIEFITKELGLEPKFKSQGGSWGEDSALQN